VRIKGDRKLEGEERRGGGGDEKLMDSKESIEEQEEGRAECISGERGVDRL